MSPARKSLALLAALAAGCGGGGDGNGEPVGGTLPDCAGENPRAEVPAGVPDELPLPPDLALTDGQRVAAGQFVLRGLVRGDLDAAAAFFERMLPERDFRVGIGDAEAHEREAPFTGHGFRGRWRVIKHPGDCPVVAVFVVLVEQT